MNTIQKPARSRLRFELLWMYCRRRREAAAARPGHRDWRDTAFDCWSAWYEMERRARAAWYRYPAH